MSLVYKILPYIDPHKVFDTVAIRYATVFLDSKLEHASYGRYSFIGLDPVITYTPGLDSSLQQQLKQFEELKNYYSLVEDNTMPELPFTGGLIGYISYEYAKQLESSLIYEGIVAGQTKTAIPDYWFGLYNQVFAFDNQKQKCYLLVTRLPDTDTDNLLFKLQNIYDNAHNALDAQIIKPKPVKLYSNFTKEEYIHVINQVKEYIKSGDIFEANIAQRFSAKINDEYNPHQLYNYLRFKNPAPFTAYLNLDKLKILSASPERFIKVNNKEVEVRPIKGTIKRDNDLHKDNFLAQTLQSSPKDRAENIMIVDLMRSDLSKICKTNSIIVSQLCGLESFTNVHHLVSVVKGKLKDNITTFDIIKAIYPAGSITGAPKIRAQQVIDELEQNTPRGVSYGSIGYLGFNSNIDLSVTIYNDELSFHVGGAITLYSNPLAEYEETLVKAQKIYESISDDIDS